jgi:hypothetical protein
MKTEKLSEIKKELQLLNTQELINVCLRLARYKKENKELLGYLLFEASDELAFAENFKEELTLLFHQLPAQSTSASKHLRKTLRLTTKYIRFAGSKQVEVEIMLVFCKNFLNQVSFRSSSRSITLLYGKQLEKIKKAILKLHEDLQFDYGQEYHQLLDESAAKIPYFNKQPYLL